MKCGRKKGDKSEFGIWGLGKWKGEVIIIWDVKGLGWSMFGGLKISFGDIRFEMFFWYFSRDVEYIIGYIVVLKKGLD